MAHWAEINESNVVTRVVVTSNDELDEGYQWLIDNLGGKWIKTSYNSYGGVHYITDENGERVPSGQPHFRYNFAGIGYIYDEERDAFIPPIPQMAEELPNRQPVLNETTLRWEFHLLPVE
jgi:hypothetical protein